MACNRDITSLMPAFVYFAVLLFEDLANAFCTLTKGILLHFNRIVNNVCGRNTLRQKCLEPDLNTNCVICDCKKNSALKKTFI